MKTVKDYLDLGLAFVDSDKLLSVSNDNDSKEVCMSWLCIAHQRYCDGIRGGNAIFFYPSEWTPSSFAWRNNDGVKPEYKGRIEVVTEGGAIVKDAVDNLQWHTSFSLFSRVTKWRPVVLQSVSPKEDKPMKPVYTAEMHARNELPPVDSKVKVCIEEAGFYVDEQDVKFEGKAVTVKAAFSNVESEKIVTVENEDGNCYCYIIECIKPIIKTIKVNGFDVPAPMSEAPEIGDEYFTPQTGYAVFYCANKWICDGYDQRFLSRGLVHATESAAIAHAKAMLGIDPNA